MNKSAIANSTTSFLNGYRKKDFYGIRKWSEGYFHIDKNGHIVVQPSSGDTKTVSLYDMVQSLVKRGIEPPILFRFDGIIRDRIDRLYNAFNAAIAEYKYKNSYQLCYPIKVNQQHHIVETIRLEGNKHSVGLEVGSKPELLAVLSLHDRDNAIFLCNGYKDAEYIELALLSKKINRRPIIIVEQFYELKLIIEIAERLGVEAEIGLRIKPFNQGSGKWASSGGEQAKFGLDTHEINLAVEHLQKAGKQHWLKLLHFHIGSQLTSIMPLKKVVREAARIYVELAKLCPSMSFLDVGGGLAVDYDGSKTVNECSMNYTIEQYARDIVHIIGSICDEENLPHPIIVSESGRALVAHHSILVTEVIDVAPSLDVLSSLPQPPSTDEQLTELHFIYNNVSKDNCLEALHDASDLKENAIERFVQGDLSLAERAYIERTYRYIIAKIHFIAKQLDYVPDEIKKLDDALIDVYFCNFSVFQSLPDSWAIQQLFPIMPIHRLDTIPNRKARIVDLTCDSDGMINNYVNKNKIHKFTALHEFNNSPYYLGIFLLGAYQETLGSFHNLFGDTNAVHVDLDQDGDWEIKHQIEGDTIKDVLGYVQYNIQDLNERMRCSIEKALRSNRLTLEESAMIKTRFRQALESYTYLVV